MSLSPRSAERKADEAAMRRRLASRVRARVARIDAIERLNTWAAKQREIARELAR